MKKGTEVMTLSLFEEVESRLPWSPVGCVWIAAKRQGVVLRVDDRLEARCVLMLMQHLAMSAGFNDEPFSEEAQDRARLLMSVMGDGFPYWAVMVGEAFVAQLRAMGESHDAYATWVESVAA